ncbi:MAG: DUF5074 domain-containing protein [Bacteroidota bacterium]
MKVKLSLFLLLLLALASCKHDEIVDVGNPANDYSTGVFVVNEGGFNGTGTISWHNETTGVTVQDVFAAENSGAVLGQFVQSLSFYKDRGYIVVNGASKVIVVDAKTFKQVGVITGIDGPRFFQPLNDEFALVSYWGADGYSGGLAKVELSSLSVLETLSLPQPEKMYALDNTHVMAANVGGYGLDSTVSIVTVGNTFESIGTLKFKGAPCCFAAVNGQAATILCKGGYGPAPDYTPYPGWLGNTGNLNLGYEIPNGSDDLCASPDKSTLYFIGGGSVWSYTGASAPVKLFDQAAYGLTCNPSNGYLYCADAKDFSSNGTVYVYKPDGTLVTSFAAGIAPGEIVIR